MTFLLRLRILWLTFTDHFQWNRRRVHDAELMRHVRDVSIEKEEL